MDTLLHRILFLVNKMKAYRDGIQDLSSRLKSKLMEYIDYLKGIQGAKPVIQMLFSAIRICANINSPIDGEELRKDIKRLYTLRKDIALSFIPDRYVDPDAFDAKSRIAWLSAGRKIILGSMEAIVGYASDEVICARSHF